MSTSVLRKQTTVRAGGRNSGNSRAQASASIGTTGPNFDREPNIGPFSKAAVAAKKFAKVLSAVTVGDIATAAGVSKETAKNWKLGKRMPNGEAMLDLGTNLRVVKDYIHCRLDGHESVEAQQAYAEVEARLASLPPHQREVVMAQLSREGAR